jgi:GTP-binding protein
LKTDATFVRSIAVTDAKGLPRDGLPELALVGRSNVGKSSLINALVRQRLARTSATPGKTRLVNIYRVTRASARPFYLVDLPGYGFTRGGRRQAWGTYEELTQTYFAGRTNRRERQDRLARVSALLLVDVRHPGLEIDTLAWDWLRLCGVRRTAIVVTKIDKLARGERIRALRDIESAHEYPVMLPVSAVTGEGLDELWKLIDRLVIAD